MTIASITTQDGNFNRYFAFLVIVAVLGITFNRVGFVALMRMQANGMNSLSVTLIDRLLHRGYRYHTNKIGGKTVSDAFDLMQSYMNITLSFFTNGTSFALTLIIGLIVVFIRSWQLGVVVFMIVTVTLLWTYNDSKRRSRLRHKRLEASKRLISHFSDVVVNAQTVKTFGMEEHEIKKVTELTDRLTKLRLKDWVIAGTNGNNRIAVLLLGITGLLYYLNIGVKADPATLGVGIFAYTYTFSLMLRLFELNNLSRLVEESFLNAGPMIEMLGEPLEVIDKHGAKKLNAGSASIEFRNVTFQYHDIAQHSDVFNNFNLTIKPGEKVGLIGPSGGGKTTLTRLVLRFEDINDGQILINGQDITEVSQVSLRQAISYVPQEPLLFHRTIRENILYGNPKASENALLNAIKHAHADAFIDELPNKIDTVVGERGVKLSGGQRQRVAIARAILKDAPILILDEATSALDSESEKYVQAALDDLILNKTTLVIAHRLSTIKKMDRILVLDNGRIIEEGTHNELRNKKDGLYARLWSHQSDGFIAEH